MRTDNYTIARDRAHDLFLAWDQNAIIRRAGVDADSKYIYISLIDVRCRIDRATGCVYLPDGEGAGYDETLTIYDYLCRTDPIPAEGAWVAMGDLRHVGQTRPSEKSLYAREAAYLQTRIDDLPRALSALGGEAFPHGDIAAIVPIVGRMRAVFQFWAGDDEFPPNAMFLWDENAWQKLRTETMYYAMGCFFRRLREILESMNKTADIS